MVKQGQSQATRPWKQRPCTSGVWRVMSAHLTDIGVGLRERKKKTDYNVSLCCSCNLLFFPNHSSAGTISSHTARDWWWRKLKPLWRFHVQPGPPPPPLSEQCRKHSARRLHFKEKKSASTHTHTCLHTHTHLPPHSFHTHYVFRGWDKNLQSFTKRVFRLKQSFIFTPLMCLMWHDEIFLTTAAVVVRVCKSTKRCWLATLGHFIFDVLYVLSHI